MFLLPASTKGACTAVLSTTNTETDYAKLSLCKREVTYPIGPPASTRRSISRPLNMTYTPLFFSPSTWVAVAVVTRKERARREKEGKGGVRKVCAEGN